MEQNLTCPITLELFENPITLPCCGQVVSKTPIIRIINEGSGLCPLCNNNLENFDVINAPITVNIQSLIDELNNKNNNDNNLITRMMNYFTKSVENPIKSDIKYFTNSMYNTKIGLLELKLPKNNYKTLLIPIIDKSGSMSRNFNQVKYSLERILDLTFDNKDNILTTIITYNDRASHLDFDTINNSKLYYNNLINIMNASGGTSFKSAFDELNNVLKKYKNNKEITSTVILFLTDGQDSSIQADKRIKLIEELSNNISNIKNIIIHTIGFTAGHDFNFLDNLRKIKNNGCYRYADPRDDTDSLSAKINSIINTILDDIVIPLEIVNINYKIISKTYNQNNYWLNLTNTNDEETEITIKLNKDVLGCKTLIIEDDSIKKMWLSKLIDDIANEVTILSKEDNINSNNNQLHIQLLINRCNAISMQLDEEHEISRLNYLLKNINDIQNGMKIDLLKLNDIKFEGKYKTNVGTVKSTLENLPKKIEVEKIIPRKYYNNWSNLKKINPFKHTESISFYAQTKDSTIKNNVLTTSNVPLICSIGRLCMIERLNKNNDIIHNGYNCLDYAIIYGWWKSVELLISKGFRTNHNIYESFQSCLLNGYFNTCEVLLRNNLIIIDNYLIDTSPNSKVYLFLTKFKDENIPIEMTFIKGIYTLFEKKIDNEDFKISLDKHLHIFLNPNDDQLKIIKKSIELNLFDVNEIIEIEENITWPLYVACETGNIALFNILKNKNTIDINFKNKKDTTMFWIACYNNHLDIAEQLINMGADINVQNESGNTPLIIACQKNLITCIELLLMVGVDVDIYNKNRDNPFLICCRTGHHKILEILINYVGTDKWNVIKEQYAEIDHFNPLFASVELDRTECIKTCLKYGCDVNSRTDDENPIIKNATPIHLCCFYGREKSIKILYENGGNIKALTQDGLTPLHLAISKGHINVVKYILSLKEGVECLNIKDNYGRKPIDYAMIEGNENLYIEFFDNKIVKYLINLLGNNNTSLIDTIENYSNSLTCYEKIDVLNTSIGINGSLLTYSILCKNDDLTNYLLTNNVDVNITDNMGISSLFWLKLLKNNKVINVNDEINIMIENVNNSMNNIQNRMILTLTNDKYNYDNEKPFGMIEKMNNYKLLNYNDLQLIKNNENTSILKILSNYKLFNYKIFTIKKIALGCKLSPIYIFAIHIFLSNKEINKLINENLNNQQHICFPLITTLYYGLDSLPNYNGEIYRYIYDDFDFDIYGIDKTITFNNFTICSMKWNCLSKFINEKKGIIFVINTFNAKNVTDYSNYNVDEDVIIMPNSKFKVINHCVADIIYLGQSNIRQSTFKYDEESSKKINNKNCIIVDIQQIE